MIMAASANTNLKRVALELGGKSPIAVFDDVDGRDILALFFKIRKFNCFETKFTNELGVEH